MSTSYLTKLSFNAIQLMKKWPLPLVQTFVFTEYVKVMATINLR